MKIIADLLGFVFQILMCFAIVALAHMNEMLRRDFRHLDQQLQQWISNELEMDANWQVRLRLQDDVGDAQIHIQQLQAITLDLEQRLERLEEKKP